MKRYLHTLALTLLLALGIMPIAPCSMLHAQVGQVTIDWTADLPSGKLPTGVTLADADTLEGDLLKIRFQIDIDASTCDNATKATAFNCVGDSLQAAIEDDWLIPIWHVDTSLAATAVILIKNIERTWDNISGAPTTDMYLVAEDVFRCYGIIKLRSDE